MIAWVVMSLLAGTPVNEGYRNPYQVAKWIEDAVAGRDVLPSLAAVQAAAVEALELPAVGHFDDLGRRARYRGWVPRVDVRVGSSRSLAVRTDALDAVDWVRNGEGLGVDVAVRWSLGEVLFSEVEVRMNAARWTRTKVIRQTRERVTAVYFDRVRILVEERRRPTEAGTMEAARLDALLRSLTGGLLDKGETP